MVLKMVLTLLVCTIVAFVFRVQIAQILKLPLIWAFGPMQSALQSISPIDSVKLSFQLAFQGGLLVACPLLLHFFAQFVLRAFAPQNTRVALSVPALEFALYLSGVLVAFFFLLTPILNWLNPGPSPSWSWDIRSYYRMVFELCIVAGLMSQMPAVLVKFHAAGVFSARQLREKRFHGYVAMVILAALMTPTPDFFMLGVFSLPLIVVFEDCIWLIWWLEKRRERREALAKAHAPMDPNGPID
jgi:sec-independent protein translocase protein TatC